MDFGGWCILRMQGRHTLRLAQSLAEDGYEVWTPVETRTFRIAKFNVKRPGRLAIMPSYIFAKAHHLIDLLQLAKMKPKPRRGARLHLPGHDDFRVMRHGDQIPMVADAALGGLRRIEESRNPKPKRVTKNFAPGASVRISGTIGNNAFAGLIGVVEKCKRGKATVIVDGRFPVQLDACMLNEPGVYNDQMPPEDGSDEQLAA